MADDTPCETELSVARETLKRLMRIERDMAQGDGASARDIAAETTRASQNPPSRTIMQQELRRRGERQ